MKLDTTQNTISRIDKVFVDRDGADPRIALRRRRARGLDIVVGADVAGSYGLQLALLTAVNLGVKCFSGNVTVHAPATVWAAACLPPVVMAPTLHSAVELLGAQCTLHGVAPVRRHLVFGDASVDHNSIRVTFDGWIAIAGPAVDVARRAERAYFPPACTAAGAIGVSEIFAEFAQISVAATRRAAELSLWRPDLPVDHVEALGEPITEAPAAIAIFGLGHLGQAYLWTWAALGFIEPQVANVLLCDDDSIETANIETGALLSTPAIGHPKTRVTATWLERRGFATRLIERRVDQNFRRTSMEPSFALSGFDDNQPRRWLAQAGFIRVFDSGLGGEAANFDSVACRTWPNPRELDDLWPVETPTERATRESRNQARASNAAYQTLGADDCGRVMLAGKSVAVPFVGAVAAALVISELLKTSIGIAGNSEVRLRICALGSVPAHTSAASGPVEFPRGVAMTKLRLDDSLKSRAA